MKAVSGKDLCRALQRKGWILVRVSSSHHVYTNPENTINVSVPVHGNRTLKTGMQHGIMKKTGLTEDDL